MVDMRVFGRTDPDTELARLDDIAVNYTLDGPPTAAGGWTFDDYVLDLPAEAPGEPQPGRTFEVACRLVRDYEFADPSIIKAVWLSEQALEGRTMLLEGRFLLLRFLLGVRVTSVVDERTEQDGRPAQVYGWCYRTLRGHLEAGEMCYHVVKMLDTGDVQFRVSRYVRDEVIRNPIIWLGLKTFGRLMQVLFVRRSLARMTRLVDAELHEGRHTAGVPLATEEIEVHEARDSPERRSWRRAS